MTIAKFAMSAAIGAALFAAAGANAAITTYGGVDEGAATTGPFPNSATAEAALIAGAAALGTVATETFETLPLGTTQPIVFAGGSITYIASDFGPGRTGISNFTFGNDFGFNSTAGGTNWLGFPDFNPSSATIIFNVPTYAFGFYLTGSEQSVYNSVFTLTQNDGSAQSFNVTGTAFGGASYFGITDTVAFTSVTIFSAANGGDAWGIDDLTYTVAVPEPATWALMIAGFGMTGFAMRRRQAAFAA